MQNRLLARLSLNDKRACICNFSIVVVVVVAHLASLYQLTMGREREEEAPVEEEVEEVEVVDPKAEVEDSCKPRCVKQLISYEACVKRIEEDEKGQKHCTGQYFDYWGCIDQCAAPKVFRKLA